MGLAACLVLDFLSVTPAQATIANLTILKVTATQAVVTYDSPTAAPCTLAVSRSSQLSPLVPDIDPALFPGSNLDTRVGAVSSGPTRVVVIGRHGMSFRGATNPFLATDGRVYSRALEANTLHFLRVICSGDSVTTSFKTANIPLGKTFGDPLPVGQPGQYNFPTLPVSRGEAIVDPYTGAALQRVTLNADASSGAAIDWPSGGFMDVCSPVLSDGGYHCAIPQTRGAANLLYWISAATGEVRLLGEMQTGQSDLIDGWPRLFMLESMSWEWARPGTFYMVGRCNYTDPAGGYVHHCVYRVTYSGGNVSVPANSLMSASVENLTKPSAGQTLTQQLVAFNPQFQPSLFGAQASATNGRYLVLRHLRYNQDSYGWISIFDLQTGQVIAMANIGGAPNSRWCGIHTIMTVGDQATVQWGAQNLRGGGSTGPWATALTSSLDAGQTTVAVAGEPLCTNGNATMCYGATSPSDTFLQGVSAGDVFLVDREQVRIVTKVSATSWTVERGYNGTSPSDHAVGAGLTPQCIAITGEGFREGFWAFLEDPTGQDATNTKFVLDDTMYGSHYVTRGQYRVMADYLVIAGSLPQALGNPVTFRLDPQPAFAGSTAPAAGNSFQKHPSYHNAAAPNLSERQWFLDYLPFMGGNLHSQSPGASLVTGSLYRYAAASAFPLVPRVFDLFGASHQTPLKNVSGPATILTGSPADAYKFCVVERAGECYPGASPGQVYANVPSLTANACTGGELSPTARDVCLGNVPAYGQAVVQFGLSQANVTTAGPPPTYGAERSRVVVSLTSIYRGITAYASAHALPDASWVLFPINWGGPSAGQVLMARLPPFPSAVLADYSAFVQTPVIVPNRSGSLPGVTNVVIEFGYAENGDPSSLFCTQREEVCLKGNQPANMFGYDGDAVAGVPCTAGCTVDLPLIPDRVAYYRIRYRNSSNTQVARGPLQIAAGAPGGLPPSSPSNLRVR